MNIAVTSGEYNLIEIEANNPFNKTETFKVKIDDPDFEKGHIKSHELVMIDNSHSEWEKWFQLEKCTKPFDWKVAKTNKMELLLDKGDKLKLLFKFITNRSPI